jgi:hypothetical protein
VAPSRSSRDRGQALCRWFTSGSSHRAERWSPITLFSLVARCSQSRRGRTDSDVGCGRRRA